MSRLFCKVIQMDNEVNYKGGILIVALPGQGAVGYDHDDRAHYFAPNVKQGKIRDALAHWFSLWGIGLTKSVSRPNEVERLTHEVVWCDEVPTHLHGPQTVAFYAEHGERVLEALERYEPKIIIVLSAYLYEALASATMAKAVTERIGRARMQPRRITQARLKALHQPFERADMLVLPTPSKNTTDAYITTLSATVRDVFTSAGFELSESPETLLEPAKDLLVIDEKKTLTRFMNQFRIDEERAKKLMQALEDAGIVTGVDEKARRYVKWK